MKDIEKVTIEFTVHRQEDVPKIGSRKKILVNGSYKYLWVHSVEVRAWRNYKEPMDFTGTALYVKHLYR